MFASPWDMSSWFNWYWWLPDNKPEINPEEDNFDSIDGEIFPKEQTISTEKPKLKRKKVPFQKKFSQSHKIQLILFCVQPF